ncbi:hypothetical protein BDQ12DRAFT_723920 [Crucibulum laeve]|uniref:F-box domain-containing protein n=1 Tax=Crucibulum laeve TaxID=68775 RepID=A0A5C3LYS6_9AGAR|nr:hypothetical protein BDQ12DRAFT_723920 [Crucibulum laeve]
MTQSPILRLPLEVLQIIIDLAPTVSQLSLSLLSKIFHSLSIRSLYTRISLHQSSSVIAFCRTLVSNSHAANAVRYLSITYFQLIDPSKIYFSSYYTLISRALQRTPNIQHLNLNVHDPNYIISLSNISLHRLVHFTCHLNVTPALVTFLNAHPKINYLELSTQDDVIFGDSPTVSIPDINLPALEYFSGNGDCIEALGSSTRLKAALVFWDVMDANPQLTISALARSSSETLNLLSCRRRGWNLDLLEVISQKLPDLSALCVNNVLVVDTHPTELTLSAIKGCLTRFTRLEKLVIHCVDVFQFDEIESRPDDDFATVTEWGEACSSLCEITLPHSNSLSWFRIAENMWIPDPRDPIGVNWLFERVVARTYPGWERVIDNLEERVRKSNSNPDIFERSFARVRGFLEGDPDADFDSDEESAGEDYEPGKEAAVDAVSEDEQHSELGDGELAPWGLPFIRIDSSQA